MKQKTAKVYIVQARIGANSAQHLVYTSSIKLLLDNWDEETYGEITAIALQPNNRVILEA